jgi:hypothetical protein
VRHQPTTPHTARHTRGSLSTETHLVPIRSSTLCAS